MADEIFKMVPEQMDKIIMENKKEKIEGDRIYDDSITQIVDKTIKSLPHQIAQSRLINPKKRWISINLGKQIYNGREAMAILERIRTVGFEARCRYYRRAGPSPPPYYYIEIRDRDLPDPHCVIL